MQWEKARVEHATSWLRVQCLIHYTTAATVTAKLHTILWPTGLNFSRIVGCRTGTLQHIILMLLKGSHVHVCVYAHFQSFCPAWLFCAHVFFVHGIVYIVWTMIVIICCKDIGYSSYYYYSELTWFFATKTVSPRGGGGKDQSHLSNGSCLQCKLPNNVSSGVHRCTLYYLTGRLQVSSML